MVDAAPSGLWVRDNHHRFESCPDYKVYKTPIRIGKHPTVTSDRQCLKIRGKEKTKNSQVAEWR